MNDPLGDSDPILDGLPVSADAGLNARDSLEVLLSQFAEEVRRGGRPSIEDYARRYPLHAAEIRELFPLVFSLESWKSNKEIECLRKTVPRDFAMQVLGDYRIVRELGRGGMGVVFQGVHANGGRSVAIKVLPWRFAADMDRWKERFYREASTIAALRHKNIVPVHSFGCHDGYYYYVMQFISGLGLNEIIEALRRSHRPVQITPFRTGDLLPGSATGTGHPLYLARDSWRGFARLGEQIADALDHAHRAEVLHNDIKPSNLLVKPDGQVIVTDFGIGRWSSPDDPPLELEDAGVGTLRYAAPERLHGRVDRRSDLYSLGVTLYELATQVVPFESLNHKELLSRVLNEELMPPRRHVPAMPVPLETILMKAAARDPADRYASAAALAEDLRRFQRGQPILARRKSWIQKAAAWYCQFRGRNPTSPP